MFLSASLVLTTGCHLQPKDAAGSSLAPTEETTLSESSASAEPGTSNVPPESGDWTAYIDGEHNLCVKQQDDSTAAVLVRDVAGAPCVAGEWVYYLPNLDEIDKVKLDGSQIKKVCETDTFQVLNANLNLYHEINGSTSITAAYKDGYILYTCVQLNEVGDKQPNPPSHYKLDLSQNTLTFIED